MPPANSSASSNPASEKVPTDIWDGLLPVVPHAKPPGEPTMLRLIAYDIADPRRWRRIANTCDDFGVRVQYSLFECWLEEDRFQQLWDKLKHLIDPKEDRLAAYTLGATDARRRVFAGETMLGTERATCYIV